MKIKFRFAATSLMAIALATPLLTQKAEKTRDIGEQKATTERLAEFKWWPTKLSTASDKYGSDADCAECHADIWKSQSKTSMAQTLLPAARSKIAEYLHKSATVDGFDYKFTGDAAKAGFVLTNGSTSVNTSLDWAFGSGNVSQVYLTASDDHYLESHFSYFETIHGVDVTPAQPSVREPERKAAADLDQMRVARGREVAMPEARACFSCHAANVPAEGPMTHVAEGVSCQACHGPGGNHTAGEKAGFQGAGALAFNPKILHADAQADFCGSCHATTIDVILGGMSGLASVRFPVYRLQSSRCWSNDERVQCTACHDPHRETSHVSSDYDAKCLRCHAQRGSMVDAQHPGKACPTSTKECSSCHMPKYELPDVHFEFTDHDIRIVRPGDKIPN